MGMIEYMTGDTFGWQGFVVTVMHLKGTARERDCMHEKHGDRGRKMLE